MSTIHSEDEQILRVIDKISAIVNEEFELSNARPPAKFLFLQGFYLKLVFNNLLTFIDSVTPLKDHEEDKAKLNELLNPAGKIIIKDI